VDAKPKPGSVETVQTAICAWCGKGIQRRGGQKEWRHNNGKVICFRPSKTANIPHTRPAKEEFL